MGLCASASMYICAIFLSPAAEEEEAEGDAACFCEEADGERCCAAAALLDAAADDEGVVELVATLRDETELIVTGRRLPGELCAPLRPLRTALIQGWWWWWGGGGRGREKGWSDARKNRVSLFRFWKRKKWAGGFFLSPTFLFSRRREGKKRELLHRSAPRPTGGPPEKRKKKNGPRLLQPGQLVPRPRRQARDTSVVAGSRDGRLRGVARRSSVREHRGEKGRRKKKPRPRPPSSLSLSLSLSPTTSFPSLPTKKNKNKNKRNSIVEMLFTSSLLAYVGAGKKGEEKEEEMKHRKKIKTHFSFLTPTPSSTSTSTKKKKNFFLPLSLQATSPPCPLAASPSSTPRHAP